MRLFKICRIERFFKQLNSNLYALPLTSLKYMNILFPTNTYYLQSQKGRLSVKGEITHRQEGVRKLMGSGGFDALVLSSAENIQYFTGAAEPSIHACGSVIIPLNGQSVLAVMWLDKEAAVEEAKEVSVQVYTPDTQGKVITKTLQRFGVEKGVIGMDDLASEYLGNSLKRSLTEAELVDATETVEGLRSVKSEEEIRFIRKACEISVEGMRVALKSLKPGITELEVAAIAEHHMIKLGSDTMKHDIIVASGFRTRLLHAFATQKKIERGDLVSIDLGSVYHGYCSDIARSFVFGNRAGELKNAFDILRAAQDEVLKELRPGVSIKELESAALKAARSSGHKLIGFVGHSIGLQVEEHPRLQSAGSSHPDLKIEKDMVVAFFQGSIQAKSNSGIRLEDTVLITESGAEMLTVYPRELFSD